MIKNSILYLIILNPVNKTHIIHIVVQVIKCNMFIISNELQ